MPSSPLRVARQINFLVSLQNSTDSFRVMSALPTHKWWSRILVICLLLTAAAWAARTIRLETELLALLPQELPSVRGLDVFSRQFASDREVIIVADESMPVTERKLALHKLKPLIATLPGVAKSRFA
jgi:predicted RND superfamily exporter protein